MEIEGWKYLLNATKRHYFKSGHSLCGKWMTLGNGGCTEDDGIPQSDDCRGCRKRLVKGLRHAKA